MSATIPTKTASEPNHEETVATSSADSELRDISAR